jgi:hypothetical protein
MVLAVAATAGWQALVGSRTECRAQQREAEEGQQQNGRDTPQAIMLAHSALQRKQSFFAGGRAVEE